MDHSYESSSKLNTQERPVRTYKRSNKPLMLKEIKLEPNIKLEQVIDIVDDNTSSQANRKDQVDCDSISIQETYPPEMLVINIKDVISSTSFDSDLLNAVKPRTISKSVTVMKSDGPGKVDKVTKSEPNEKSTESIEHVKSGIVPIAEPKRPEAVLEKSGHSESLESNSDCSGAAVLKPKSPEVVLPNPECSETAFVNQESSEAKPKRREMVLRSLLNGPNISETDQVKQEIPEALPPKSKKVKLNKPETVKVNKPKMVKLKPMSSEAKLCKNKSSEAEPLKTKSPKVFLFNPKSSETILVDRKNSGTVSLNRKGSKTVLLKPKSSETVFVRPISVDAQPVKPKCSLTVQPKPENSEVAQLRLKSCEAAVSKPDCSTATPLIANVSKVVQSSVNTSEVLLSKQSVQVQSVTCSAAKPTKAEERSLIVDKRQGCASTLVTPKAISPEPILVKSDLNETKPVQPVKTEGNEGHLPVSEATLVNLNRQGTVLVMTPGNKHPVKCQWKLAPQPELPERTAERPDEIIPEPDLIKLNLPDYVVDYEPNSNAPAVPSAALFPLTPIPLPKVIEDEPPMIVDSVKYLQERITPLLPRGWTLRLEKDGIFAMLFGPGITCAVQRAVYAAYDGSDLRFVVHGKILPKDHSAYKYRLMKPTLPLSVETVREFADVVMGAIHSMIQHHVCVGVDDERFIREMWDHPGCQPDDNFYGEEDYTKTLRSVDCAYLVWRKNAKRCSECLFFKTLWKNRSRKRLPQTQAVWKGREPKSRRR